MNYKKLGITTIAVFAAYWITNFLIHGVLLKNQYQETAHLWRPESEMQQYRVPMILGQFLTALFFSMIFVHGYKGKGPIEGVRYGLLMGGVFTAGNLIMYAVAPWPLNLVVAWSVASIAQSVLLGVICTFTYKA